MKIAFVTRSTLFKQPGGDTQQVQETAHELQLLDSNIEVDVILSSRGVDLASYDLIHFFNLGRPADLLRHQNWEKRPLFISTIWVDYHTTDAAEWMKVIARGLIGNDLLPPMSYVLDGHRKSIQKILDESELFVTTTQREIERLQSEFSNAEPALVIPPGLNRNYLEPLPPETDERSGILCVGRFEPLKNQLSVIRATQNWDEQITFVGDPAANNPAYYRKCKSEAGRNHHFRPHSSLEALQMLYRSHKVVIVPSHFETFGLTALEGLSQGCNVVLSGYAGASECLKEHAVLIEPNSIDSIKEGLKLALESSTSKMGVGVARSYTWKSAAETLLSLYRSRLSD